MLARANAYTYKGSINIRNRVKELRHVKASELRPNPRNWRTHPTEQVDALKGILADVGYAGAALARELPDGTLELIDGHARAEVSGNGTMPVLVLDVTEDEANKILATFDPLGAMAGTDAAKLDELLASVSVDNDAVSKMLDDLATAVVPGVEESELPDLATGDRQPFQQMTFTIHDDQAQTIKDAMEKAKKAGGDTSEVNENSNGNALAYIAEVFLGIG